MKIKIGPSGLGPVKEAIENLEKMKSLGLEACEIAFTRNIYIKDKKDAEAIGEAAKKLGIVLSIHAPYFVNLNSEEKEKIEASKQRILKCCEVGTWLGAYRVVFHSGYYGKMSREETFENIKNRITEMIKVCEEKGFTSKLAPEIMGKINVFGSIDEIASLVDQTGCEFCIDFAHIKARYGNFMFEDVIEKFGKHAKWHIHFSGIEYGEKGEKRHLLTDSEEYGELFKNLPKNKEIVIINESPANVDDAVLGVKIINSIDKK